MALLALKLRDRDVSVRFSSSLDAVKYLESFAFECHDIPPIGVELDSEGHVSFKKTLGKFVPSLGRLASQIHREIGNLRAFDPALVLSDSRLSTLIAARLLSIPSIVILNQLKLLIPTRFNSRLKGVSENLGAELLGRAWSFSEEILIPDLPPPFTLSHDNLWGIRSPRRKMRYVGFIVNTSHISDDRLHRLGEKLRFDDEKATVFVPVSGPAETREGLKRIALKLASQFQEDYNFVISGGTPGSDSQPTEIPGGWYYEWCPVKDELFHISDLIIARPGHLTTAQTMLHGKPFLAVPIPNQSEQMANSRKVEDLGFGLSLDQRYDSLQNFQETMRNLLHDPAFKERAGTLREVCQRHNGLETTLDVLSTTLNLR